MQVKQTGSTFEFFIEGPISEKCPLFDYNIAGATEIHLDLEKMTFINSIGVKNWINWTFKVSRQCQLKLYNCPFVIINQINMVQGFLPTHARIESFSTIYINDAGDEMTVIFKRGVEYEYATAGLQPRIEFPEKITNAQGVDFEPDFVMSKITKFLTPT